MSPLLARVCNIFKSLAVEPVAFFSFLALSFYQVVTQVGVYRLICFKMYHFSHPEVDCNHLAGNSSTGIGLHVENDVQKGAAAWGIAMGLSYMIPAIFSDIFLGALGDRYGRKINIMLGVTGLMVAMFPYTLVFTYPATVPMYVILIGQVLSGFSGFISIITISSFAYLADTVVDREMLTIRMTFIQIAIDIANIVGSLLISGSARWMTSAQMILLCEGILTLGFFFCLLRVSPLPPTILRRMMQEKRRISEAKEHEPQLPMSEKAPKALDALSDAHSRSEPPRSRGCLSETKALCVTVGTLLKDVWVTYRKPRPGHIRAYLFITALVVFMHMTAELGIRVSVFALYVQKAPLGWDQEMIGYFKTTTAALRLVGLFSGGIIFKKCFHLSDTTIILVSLGSTICELTLFAFGTKTWMIYLATVLGSFANLINPCIKSLIAKLVGPEEVGKAFTAFGLATNVAILCATSVYNGVYAATVDFYPGFVFLVGSTLVILTTALFLWVHVDYHRQHGSGWACCRQAAIEPQKA